MIELNLDDSMLTENYDAIKELRKTGLYSEQELQELYDKQVKLDKEKENEK